MSTKTDPYRRMAAEYLGKPYEEVTKSERTDAKRLYWMVSYGVLGLPTINKTRSYRMTHHKMTSMQAEAAARGELTEVPPFGFKFQEAGLSGGVEIAPKMGAEAVEVVVPPAGIEPAPPKGPHFECGASTSSTRGAGGSAEPFLDVASVRIKYGHIGHMVASEAVWMVAARLEEGIPQSPAWRMVVRLGDVLSRLVLPFGWHIRLTCHTNGKHYLQVACDEAMDNSTFQQVAGWTGRKWYLSPHMTDGEIVQTAFKAALTAVEHEVREMFTYRGAAIYDPHYDIERLVELRQSKGALRGRADGMGGE